MSAFTADWLRLREPLDAASRDRNLSMDVARLLRAADPRSERVRVVDLGAGSGANLRYLAPLLGGAQDWLLVDHDPQLLDEADERIREWALSVGAPPIAEAPAKNLDPCFSIAAATFDCRVSRTVLDIATELARLSLSERALVTASALLDLVSEAWLSDLARRCLDARACVLFALTYDGRSELHPEEPDDRYVRELFNCHQLSDKGFGHALGPAAASNAQQIFEGLGYVTRCARSDWRIGPGESSRLQLALLEGWFEAALEMAPGEAKRLHDWHRLRQQHVDARRSALRVGHVDMIGYLSA